MRSDLLIYFCACGFFFFLIIIVSFVLFFSFFFAQIQLLSAGDEYSEET